MAHPDWVLKHKLPNTEIRCIRGRYYLYSITSVWSPEKGRNKKVTLKSLGVITQEYGLIPRGMSRRGKVPEGQSKLKVDEPAETNFNDFFGKIEDPRSPRNQLYSIAEILLVTFFAVICGAEGWADLENYGKSKLTYLRKFYDFKNGIPSDDTFRRFFRSLDPEPFKQIFHKWVQSLALAVGVKVIAIDGKASRRSHDGDEPMLHTVSAFATEARIVLGQEKVLEKSNEITAIPKLLALLDVKDKIITIDAMGCQYAIANQIVEKGGDYIFSLKGNQGNLSDDVDLYMQDVENTGKQISSYTDVDKGHGRIETRTCVVSHNVEWLRERHPKWHTIQCIIQIHSTRDDGKTITTETRTYISSFKSSPKEALTAIRNHWGIESFHWVLDMSFNEDYSRIRKGNAPQVMAIIRHAAFNLLQHNKLKAKSIKGMRKMCGWDNDLLDQLIAKQKS